MIKNLIKLLLMTLVTCGFADDDLLIYLQSNSQMSPLYVAPMVKKDAPYPDNYYVKLQELLCFDFESNGRCHLLKQEEKTNQIIQSEQILHLDPQALAKFSMQYAVKILCNSSYIEAIIFDLDHKKTLQTKQYSLNGDIQNDIKQIHELHDDIHFKLFHEEGIASCKILYAYQKDFFNDLDQSKWQSDIYMTDTSGQINRLAFSDKSYAITPKSYPNIDAFLYVSYKTGIPKIYQAQIGNLSGTPLVNLRGNQLLAEISPKGNYIAYISDAAGRADLFIQAFDEQRGTQGKPIQIYSFPRAVQASPTFSPDGRKIAFVSDKDRTPRIYIIDITEAKTSRKRPEAYCITKENRENTSPSWSMDGTKIVYSARTKGIRQIWMYDLLEGIEKQLTFGPGHKENPSWAPNSLHIVYNSTSPKYELYMININQLQPIQLSQGVGIKHYPTWYKKKHS